MWNVDFGFFGGLLIVGIVVKQFVFVIVGLYESFYSFLISCEEITNDCAYHQREAAPKFFPKFSEDLELIVVQSYGYFISHHCVSHCVKVFLGYSVYKYIFLVKK